MIHGLNNTFLYAAKKVTTRITNGINTIDCWGTGFFINDISKLFFITNRHMIEPGFGNPSLADYRVQDFFIESYKSFEDVGKTELLNTGRISNFSEFTFDKNTSNDVACLADVCIEGEGLTISGHIDYSMLADRKWINDKLSVCDSIAYPGFPEWYDRKNATPIFRMGTIASDPRLDYSIDSNEENAERIAYEGFSSGGSSGSPVFAIQKGFQTGEGISAPDDFYREVKLVGINAGHFPVGKEGHSGVSYFYKSSAIINIIEKMI